MKFPSYEKQKLEFIEEVNKIGLTNDGRQMVLLLGIYSEYVVNELLRIKLLRYKFNKTNSQNIKLKILLSHSLLTEKEYVVFDKLNQIRNEYAHNLIFDSRKIEKRMFETPLNWKMDDQILKKIENILKKNMFDRFQKICLSNIIFLFERLITFTLEKN